MLFLQTTCFEIGGDGKLIVNTPTVPLLVSHLLVNTVLCLPHNNGETAYKIEDGNGTHGTSYTTTKSDIDSDVTQRICGNRFQF